MSISDYSFKYIFLAYYLKLCFYVEFDFTWFHNNHTVVKEFNPQIRNVWVSRWEEYWNYCVLINAFWIRLDLSDIGIWYIDLSGTDLDSLDKDIPIFSKTSSRRLQRSNFSSSKSSRFEDVFKTNKCLLAH